MTARLLLWFVAHLARPFDPAAYDAPYMQRVLTERVVALHLHPMQADSTCLRASQTHSVYLAAVQDIVHEETLDVGLPLRRTLGDRQVNAEICLSYLAYSSDFSYTYEQLADKMIESWLHSPAHAAILQNPRLEKLGAGVSYDPGTDTFYAVVDFRFHE